MGNEKVFFSAEDFLGTKKAREYFNKKIKAINELKEQYNNQDNRWLLTFTKHLEQDIDSITLRLNIDEALDLIEIYISLEKKIINSGFLKLFIQEKRKKIKEKAELSLKLNIYKKNAILFYKKGLNIFDKKNNEKDIKILEKLFYIYFFFQKDNVFANNSIVFIKRNKDFLKNVNEKVKKYLLEILIKLKKNYRENVFDNTINLDINLDNEEKKNFEALILLNYYELLILKDLERFPEFSKTIITFIKHYAHFINKVKHKIELITLANYLIDNSENCNITEFFSWDISPFNVVDNLKIKLSKKIEDYLDSFIKTFEINKEIQCIVEEQLSNGYLIKHNNYYGVIRFDDILLHRRFNVGENIIVKIAFVCQKLPFFFAYQIPEMKQYFFQNTNFSFENFLSYEKRKEFLRIEKEKYIEKITHSLDIEKKALVYEGRIKNIIETGIFVDFTYFDGFLPISEITYEEKLSLHSFFQKNEIRPFAVIQVNTSKKNKVDVILSIKNIKDIYYKSSSQSSISNSNYDISSSNKRHFLIEKAFLLEYLSELEKDIFSKINYLEIGKILHVLISNKRSYLLNFHINYYKIILLFNSSSSLKDIVSKITLLIKKDWLLEIHDHYKEIQDIIDIFFILTYIGKTEFRDIIELFNLSSFPQLQNLIKIVAAYNLLITLGNKSIEKKIRKDIYNFLLNGKLLRISLLESSEDISEEDKIRELIQKGESKYIEFKSTFFYNIEKGGKDKKIGFEIVKTISAFLNSFGGKLLVGVNDDGEILGLSYDMKLIKGNKNKKDELKKNFDHLLSEYNLNSFSSFITFTFNNIEEKTIVLIDVLPSKEKPVFLKDEFYIRKEASSQKLNPKEFHDYWQNRSKII